MKLLKDPYVPLEASRGVFVSIPKKAKKIELVFHYLVAGQSVSKISLVTS